MQKYIHIHYFPVVFVPPYIISNSYINCIFDRVFFLAHESLFKRSLDISYVSYIPYLLSNNMFDVIKSLGATAWIGNLENTPGLGLSDSHYYH